MDFVITRSRLTIATIDWPASLQFYQDLLQMPPQVLQPDRYAEFVLPGCTIALYAPRAAEIPQPRSDPHPSFSLCLDVTSLANAIARLTALKYPIPHGIQPSRHGQEIYLYDPNGNRIILYEPN
jgi:catechol 2,3-dioxygenase-like lactoylglutathione lyase family enzyme